MAECVAAVGTQSPALPNDDGAMDSPPGECDASHEASNSVLEEEKSSVTQMRAAKTSWHLVSKTLSSWLWCHHLQSFIIIFFLTSFFI